MTVSQLLQEIAEVGVSNPRLSSNFMGWLNRAQRNICQRGNFNGMHQVNEVTLLAGNNSVSLGTSYKDAAPEYPAVTYVSPTGGSPIPCKVISRAMASRYRSFWSFPFYAVTQPYLPPRYVFIEQDSAGPWTLYLPPEIIAQADTTFNIEGFFYPDDFVSGSDTNWLTTHGALCDALINLTKALAYRAIDPTDPKAMASDQEYDKYFLQARYMDTAQRLSGRQIHM
jgi:hypothetical protein